MTADFQECQQIDIWYNNDGYDMADFLNTNLSRISPFPVCLHDIAKLTDRSHYATMNGTLVVVISPDTISMLATTQSLNFSDLQTTESHRYYVDRHRLLNDHNTRVSLIGGEAMWIHADLSYDDPKSSQSIFREIVHCTVRGADDSPNLDLTRNRQKKVSKKGRRGAFTVIPNEFQLGMIRAERRADAPPDGTVIIETSDLGWEFKGDPLTGYLVNQANNNSEKIAIDLTKLVAARVYSFKLPENLEPATYMIHLKDGNLPTDHELGNRRLRVYSSVSFISENLFSETHLATLCDVPNLSTPQNCQIADQRLCEYFEKTQLPLMLPRQLGKKLPTLLHVACYYGMNELFAKIIDSFCSLDALNIPNESLKRPGDLAIEQNHILLAELLSNQLTIQEMYVDQYSLYVSHDPQSTNGDEFSGFYDVYTTVNSNSVDDGYVEGARTVHANGEDPDYGGIYTSVESGRPPTFSRPASVRDNRNQEPQRAPSPPTSKTLPRSFNSGSLFMRDIPAEAIVTGDFKQDHANEFQGVVGLLKKGDINLGLAEKHMRDWTKRMNSLKRLSLKQRLEQQVELKSEMKENSSLMRNRSAVNDMVVRPTPAHPGPPPTLPRSNAPPPPVVPRKDKVTVEKKPKKLPAPPPDIPPDAPPRRTVAPNRRL